MCDKCWIIETRGFVVKAFINEQYKLTIFQEDAKVLSSKNDALAFQADVIKNSVYTDADLIVRELT